MITGGYCLDLYCVNGFCISRLTGIYGINKQEAMKQAKKAGWVFKNGDVECPKCAKKSK